MSDTKSNGKDSGGQQVTTAPNQFEKGRHLAHARLNFDENPDAVRSRTGGHDMQRACNDKEDLLLQATSRAYERYKLKPAAPRKGGFDDTDNRVKRTPEELFPLMLADSELTEARREFLLWMKIANPEFVHIALPEDNPGLKLVIALLEDEKLADELGIDMSNYSVVPVGGAVANPIALWPQDENAGAIDGESRTVESAADATQNGASTTQTGSGETPAENDDSIAA